MIFFSSSFFRNTIERNPEKTQERKLKKIYSIKKLIYILVGMLGMLSRLPLFETIES